MPTTTFDRSLQATYQTLTAFAQNANFLTTIDRVFGTDFDRARMGEIRQQWLVGDFRSLPSIEIVPADVLGTAQGAYGASTNTIYVSTAFIENADEPAIAGVLSEEIGHWVDNQINTTDTPGDEGELFSALLWNRDLSPAQLNRIQQEDDSKTIFVDGQFVSVEQANFPGTTGNDNLTGTSGDDTFTPLTGIDTVNGGAGTDTLVVDYSGTHTAGIVYSTYTPATGSGSFYAYNGGVYDQVNYSNIEKFNLTGTAFADDIRGGADNDILNGGGGNDSITAGGGVDIIDGGAGIDAVSVDVSSTATANTIDLANASNTLANGTQLLNIERFSSLTTGAGNDRITTGNYDDTIDSGAGDDVIDAKDGNNTIDAGSGNDTVTTGSGNDNISGGAGNDTIASGAGNDTINGGNDDDIINPGTGIDTVNGGAGTDTLVVDYSGTHTAGIVYSTYTPATGSGSFYAYNGGVYDQVNYSNIEQLNITGTAFADDIRGGTGNDIISAGAGDDTLTDGGGVDIIDGGAGTDNITIDISSTAGNNTIDLNNVSNTLANGTQLSNIERFASITTGAGNDTITAKIGNYNDIINSGAGNDTIDAKDGTNTVNGGDGNDNILTGVNNDTINGGNDDDTINPGTGIDTVNGGAGTDTLVVDYSGTHTGGIVYSTYTPTTGSGSFYAYNGGVYDQVNYSSIEKFDITGTANADDIRGGTGNDTLKGGAGNDLLTAGGGVDILDGGTGIDGVDVDVSSTATANNIDLTNSTNTLANGTQLLNIERFTSLKTGAGDDVITTGNYDDTIDSGTGNDTINAKDGNNIIDAGSGNDTVTTGSGNDNISGGDGNDTIASGAGNDTINGGNDDDIINPGTGIDTVNGGAGIDTLVVDYSGTHTAGIVYSTYTPATGSGSFYAYNGGVYDQVNYSNIEQLNITGTAFADDLRDGNGNDTLIGGAGDDSFTDSGNGVDSIDGGMGVDRITIDLSSTAGNNTIDLNNASNILANGTEIRNIEWFANLTTGTGNDTITAKTGNYNDIINSGGGNDTIDAKDGTNTVNSGDGNDTIASGAGNDTINGGNDDDIINPGTGIDTVNGGAGIDTLVVDYSGTHTAGIVYSTYTPATGSGSFYAYNGGVYDQVNYSNIEKLNITGTAFADDLRGGNGADLLKGGKGNDTITGNAGNDIIIGVNNIDTNPGNAEIDTLTGGADNDIFVLAANGKDFYATSGNGDYAKITDFSLTQDVIQLRGAATDYSVTSNPTNIGGVTAPSTALYRGSELIAVLQGVTSTSVNLNSTAFSYSDFTIINDLPPIVTIANASPVNEGQSGTTVANFTVTLSSPTSRTVIVPYSTADGTATTGDNDYIGTNTGSITFLPGETSKNISVVINGDTKVESDETFTVTLGTPTNGTLGATMTATGSIVNDDTTVTIANSVNGAEGNNLAQFTLTRVGVIASPLTVTYTLAGTATNGSDYNIPLSTTFAAGSNTAVVNLNTIDDNLFEGATPETVIVNLTAGTNYTLGTTPTATISIVDNDSRPTVSINNISVTEGNSGNTNGAFTLTLSNPTTEIVTVDYNTANGTAIAGSDYTAATGTVTFAAGQTSQTVNVPIIGDLNFEDNEAFNLNLTNPTNATLGTSSGTGTIVNDDLPTLTVAATIANAGETLTNPGQFTITRSGVITNALDNIKYTLSGTATNGADYSLSGTTAFAAGSSTLVVDLNVIDDNIFEGAILYTGIT